MSGSYAIATKKRKFDRLLESLTEPPSPATSSSSAQQSAQSTTSTTTSKTLRQELIEASKRRRVSSAVHKPGAGVEASRGSLTSHYLPSSRAAFLERLETFRHITKWRVSSTSGVNAAEWAKRGWVCGGVDTVACGSCGERVVVDLDVEGIRRGVDEGGDDRGDGQDAHADAGEEAGGDEGERDATGDEEDVAGELYEALVKRYADMITTAHVESCSWRRRGCDSSIQRIEGLLNTSGAISAVKSRFESMMGKIDDIPAVSDLPTYEDLSALTTQELEELEFSPTNPNALKLAICGWQYKEADVVECKHCFRSLGLWLYRGSTPTMENLDAIESHLEYCPWRSPEAQDTELTIHPDSDRSLSKKLKLPGWVLVAQAVRKHNLKKKGGANRSSISLSQVGGDGVEVDRQEFSPEQREKKMKDLVRRIKEIKKPFNMKSLLRRKDRSDPV